MYLKFRIFETSLKRHGLHYSLALHFSSYNMFSNKSIQSSRKVHLKNDTTDFFMLEAFQHFTTINLSPTFINVKVYLKDKIPGPGNIQFAVVGEHTPLFSVI